MFQALKRNFSGTICMIMGNMPTYRGIKITYLYGISMIVKKVSKIPWKSSQHKRPHTHMSWGTQSPVFGNLQNFWEKNKNKKPHTRIWKVPLSEWVLRLGPAKWLCSNLSFKDEACQYTTSGCRGTNLEITGSLVRRYQCFWSIVLRSSCWELYRVIKTNCSS